MKRDFGTLFDRVYVGGEDLGYQQTPVSWQSAPELPRGLNQIEPVVIRVFDRETNGYQTRQMLVNDVQTLGDTAVYEVVDVERPRVDLFEFVVAEGKMRFNYGDGPKEIHYISFCVAVEPVDSHLT